MRLSPSGLERDPLDPGPQGFAHRGLHRPGVVAENSLAAFAAAIEFGAGIECDLRLTADDELLVFHDRDTRRLCGTELVIGKSKLAEIAALNVKGSPIPTLAGLLALVDGRAPLLLEAKLDRDPWRFGRALVRQLDGYCGRVGVMSFDPRLARLLKSHRPAVRRGLVIRDSLSPFGRWCAMVLASPDFIAVETTALDKGWVTRARRRFPVYAWTVKNRADRARCAVLADASIWEADGRP